MTDRNTNGAQPPMALLVEPKPWPPLAFLAGLQNWVKGVLALFAFGSVVVGGTLGWAHLATETELSEALAVDRTSQAKVDDRQDEQIKVQGEQINGLDEDTELLFQTTVRLSTQAEWSNQVLWLLAQEQGLRVRPPPAARPTPSPTAATP